MSLAAVLVKAYNAAIGREQDVHASFNGLKILQTEHERIHAGKYFKHSHVHSLATAGNHYHYIQPNSGTTLHLRSYSVKADNAPGIMYLYEAPFFDINSAGTDVSSDFKTLNRKSTNSMPATIYFNPFVNTSSLGEELLASPVFDVSKDAGETAEILGNEIPLDDQKGYLVRYFNNAGANVTTGIDIGLYDAI